jgi:putative flippase GtrA
MTLLPLQVPGAPELLILLLVLVVAFGLVGRWVYRDARSRGSEWAWQWGVGIAVLSLVGLVPGLLGLVVYLVVRGDRVGATP